MTKKEKFYSLNGCRKFGYTWIENIDKIDYDEWVITVHRTSFQFASMNSLLAYYYVGLI